ncbi:MAG: hypothetical protein FJ104_12100, partial [Deltaproteobacteria bacterium]|nr:hypothetical protein [Deltaproteobacteria bacterium]
MRSTLPRRTARSPLPAHAAVVCLALLGSACGDEAARGLATGGADASGPEGGATPDAGGGAVASPLPGQVPPGNCEPGGPLCVKAPADGFLVESRGTVV